MIRDLLQTPYPQFNMKLVILPPFSQIFFFCVKARALHRPIRDFVVFTSFRSVHSQGLPDLVPRRGRARFFRALRKLCRSLALPHFHFPAMFRNNFSDSIFFSYSCTSAFNCSVFSLICSTNPERLDIPAQFSWVAPDICSTAEQFCWVL